MVIGQYLEWISGWSVCRTFGVAIVWKAVYRSMKTARNQVVVVALYASNIPLKCYNCLIPGMHSREIGLRFSLNYDVSGKLFFFLKVAMDCS